MLGPVCVFVYVRARACVCARARAYVRVRQAYTRDAVINSGASLRSPRARTAAGTGVRTSWCLRLEDRLLCDIEFAVGARSAASVPLPPGAWPTG